MCKTLEVGHCYVKLKCLSINYIHLYSSSLTVSRKSTVHVLFTEVLASDRIFLTVLRATHAGPVNHAIMEVCINSAT